MYVYLVLTDLCKSTLITHHMKFAQNLLSRVFKVFFIHFIFNFLCTVYQETFKRPLTLHVSVYCEELWGLWPFNLTSQVLTDKRPPSATLT